MSKPKYLNIVKHYEETFQKYGNTHLGVDWPDLKGAETRYQVMIDILKKDNSSKISLLDFGCGTSGLYEYIKKKKINNIQYSGLDLSNKFINFCQNKYPQNNYYCLDIIKDKNILPDFDYIVMNGVFTEKRDLSFSEMFFFMKKMLIKIFPKAKKGLAFNIMSKQVDWEKPAAFHLSFDKLANFLSKDISRHFIFLHDYGLYEYTAYVYK